jgi:hypothetical protein
VSVSNHPNTGHVFPQTKSLVGKRLIRGKPYLASVGQTSVASVSAEMSAVKETSEDHPASQIAPGQYDSARRIGWAKSSL